MSKDKGENQPTLYGIPDYDDWIDSNNYKQYDRVNYKGAIYAARVSNSGVNPFFDDGTTWELVYGYAFEDNDTMEVENSNGTLISGRKVNASGGIGSNVTSKGLNIWGIKASKDTYGVVKAGDGISIDDGVISANTVTPYVLPKATNSVLGGVKIGSGVNVADDGTISVEKQEVSYTTKSNAGIIRLGDGLKVENASGLTSVDYGIGLTMINGKISGKIATADSLGVVKPDGDTITINEDGTLVATPAVPTNGWEKIDIDFSSVINGTKLDCYKSSIFILLRLYTTEYFTYSQSGTFLTSNSLFDIIKFENKSSKYTKTIAPIIAISGSKSSEITGLFENTKFSIDYSIGNNTSSVQAGQTIAEFIFPINTFI